MSPRLFLFFAVLLAAMAGCNSIGSRIREKQAVFNGLDPQTQAKIRQGVVAIGYTPDMVYIALGPPGAQRPGFTPNGDETIWIYKTYYRKYEGMVFAGYQYMVINDPSGHGGQISLQPVSAPVYSQHEQDKLRIHFVNGRVSAIDKLRGG
ncbi:MAG TPA: hypothetical protein VK785_04840 [Opitutaceae bacterium]|jgi:hypothetical protein|nr:hypothetical protein [Opitutaceae bacterium]